MKQRHDAVLLVEDTRSDALLYSALLRAADPPRQVDHVTTLQAAMDALEDGAYAAALLDLGLPDSVDLQGLERIVCRHPELAVVVLTGREDSGLGERAIAAGAQDYLLKGDTRPGDLERVLRHAQGRKALENRLREAESARRRGDQRLATLADALPLLLMFVDRDLRVEFINSGWTRELRRPAERILGQPVVGLIREPAASHIARGLAIARGGEAHNVEFEDPDDTGVRTWAATFIPQSTQEGEVEGIHVMLRDVSLEKARRQELVRRAQQDPLTGALNRAGFQLHGGHAWAEAARLGTPLVVYFVDMDGFKQINDTLGHAAGDGMLQAAAGRVQACVRPDDLLARLGGDEFALIARNIADGAGARCLADKLIDAVNDAPGHAGTPAEVSCSVGYCIADPVRLTLSQALRRADEALYAAKRAGKGRAVQWQPNLAGVEGATLSPAP